MKLDDLAEVAARAFVASHGSTEKDWWGDAVLAVIEEIERQCVPKLMLVIKNTWHEQHAVGWNACRATALARIHDLRKRA